MQVKIYVDEAPIYIVDELSDDLKKRSKEKDNLFLQDEKLFKAADVLKVLEAKQKKAVIMLTENLTKTKNNFFEQFSLIEAAGGIVQNENKEILFIYRRGKWDLPKGKMEKGETPEIAAEREIEEETGVKKLKIKYKVGETYHIYKEKTETILKISHWYNFESVGKQHTAAQTEEGIAEVKWIATKNIKEPMKNTYNNIKDILSTFFDTP